MKNLPKLFAIAFLTSLLAACGGSKIIQKDGLSYARIGDEMPPAGIGKLKGRAVRDSLMQEEEFQWRASVVKYGDGFVYLEEDFFQQEMLNRIRIETPKLKLRNGLHVGSTVDELKAIGGEWYINPMPKFKAFDFYNRFLPNTHFVVPAGDRDLSNSDHTSYPINSFDGEMEIAAIVIY